MLTVMALQGEDTGACRDVNFDPLVLPAGIAASDDPLLSARSAAYSRVLHAARGRGQAAECGSSREGS